MPRQYPLFQIDPVQTNKRANITKSTNTEFYRSFLCYLRKQKRGKNARAATSLNHIRF